ncbi:glucose PTS transporter subunit IIA [Clostridium sp. D2Q-11]|uniref:Glucose PTS transporter subunit IIA n=1 Tax=Anaeromonas frigoriresistens TaxID=2683708 RepID=A0A942Z7S2_9FIRM|nr:glucose PTS transporter subunit IIA [Anaeromonas frigoriresistens]MBS4537245.1 glucose PTS transporter subunit IIA [Anaeromonas frigoriresistens]
MSNGRNKLFSILQKIGKSLMMPVSVLPAAGLLVALGRMLQNATETASGEITNSLFNGLGNILYSGGLAIFEQLPVVFAIGVAIGFAGGAGVAGLAAVVGYFTMTNVINVMGELRGLDLAINTGVFGGIIIGLVSAKLYQRFFRTKLHPVLGFFSGKRLVPIVTAATALGLGILFGFIWPPIQDLINSFGKSVMASELGPAFYAAGKRLLIPVGLHHVYYPPFLYEFGEFVTDTGEILRGETTRYFAGDPTAGRFMAAEFPIMLFGLPAATLAMYLRADKSKKKAIAGIMVPAALTSIITGITEPIEFAFIFVAPVLYVFHVAGAFVSGLLTNFFNIHLGYTFSASLIDYVVGFFNQQNSIYLFTIVGPIIFALYFAVFYYLIKALDLKTPGREDEEEGEITEISASEKAAEVLKALGDAKNIENIDACITRLRLNLHDSSIVDKKRLKNLGASGIMDAGGGNVQVIFGTESDQLKEEIKDIIAMGDVDSVKIKDDTTVSKEPTTTKSCDAPIAKKDEVIIKSPLTGELVKVEDVPDATFAQKFLGDGIAIKPTSGIVTAPIDGKIAQLFKTKHAIGIVTNEGVEILIHIGIDTVNMEGRGFEAFVSQGDTVKVGDKLIEFDLELIQNEAKSIITPVIITNIGDFKGFELLTEGKVNNNEDLLKINI